MRKAVCRHLTRPDQTRQVGRQREGGTNQPPLVGSAKQTWPGVEEVAYIRSIRMERKEKRERGKEREREREHERETKASWGLLCSSFAISLILGHPCIHSSLPLSSPTAAIFPSISCNGYKLLPQLSTSYLAFIHSAPAKPYK